MDAVDTSLEFLLLRLARHSNLSTEACEALLRVEANPRALRAKQLNETDDVEGLHLVVSGLLSSFETTLNGHRQIIALHVPGDLLNIATFRAPRAGLETEALIDSIIATIAPADLDALLARRPAFATAFWREGAADARILAKWTINRGRKSAQSRLTHLLCEMACRFRQAVPSREVSFELAMTQQHIADALAMTSVHLNRELQKLRRSGMISIRHRSIEIHDWSAITAIAEFDPRYLGLPPCNLTEIAPTEARQAAKNVRFTTWVNEELSN